MGDRSIMLAMWVSHPPVRFVIGWWALACSMFAWAFSQRTTIEQWGACGFLLAAMALWAAWPQRNMMLAFVGFGLAMFASMFRAASSLIVSDGSSGAIIILVAWTMLTYGAATRMSAAYLAAVRPEPTV